jgi:hypothetical protein
MPSVEFVHGVTDEATAEDFLVLLTLTHPDLAALEADAPELGVSGGALRLVNHPVNIVSRGETYLGFPFSWVDPEQGERPRPRARLRIDNVDRRITQLIRSLSSAPYARAEIVLGSDPDTVERAYPPFVMTSADWGDVDVSADLGVRDDDDEPVCAWSHSPKFSPALF